MSDDKQSTITAISDIWKLNTFVLRIYIFTTTIKIKATVTVIGMALTQLTVFTGEIVWTVAGIAAGFVDAGPAVRTRITQALICLCTVQ